MTRLLTSTSQDIERAAAALRAGQLVAFPTETVYGLGANALDAAAVARIFAAKGRPAGNPLIVHVHGIDQARMLAAGWTVQADQLSKRFWPGPLTVVLPKASCVPANVTAGGETVAIRMPAHDVARRLLLAAGVPIAAPSANRSMHISPTTAQHVLADLDGQVDWIIDGGPTSAGIESTVIDLSRVPPCVLRPGPIQAQEIEAALGMSLATQGVTDSAHSEANPARSPGQMPRHYAPRVPVELTSRSPACLAAARLAEGKRVGVLTFEDDLLAQAPGLIVRRLPCAPVEFAAGLYAALRQLEVESDCIIVRMPQDSAEWLAVRDRLQRAAST